MPSASAASVRRSHSLSLPIRSGEPSPKCGWNAELGDVDVVGASMDALSVSHWSS